MHKNYSVLLGTKTFRCSLQYTALLTLPDHLWRQMALLKDVLHPVSYMTVDYSLSGIGIILSRSRTEMEEMEHTQKLHYYSSC